METTTERKMIDCGWFAERPEDCSLQLRGRPSEVLEAAVQHAVTAHGHADGPELREMLAGAMRQA